MLTIAFGAVLSLYAQAPPDFIPRRPSQVKKLLAEGANPYERHIGSRATRAGRPVPA